MRCASTAPVASLCSSTSAAPGRGQRLGVLPLVIVGRRRQRNQNRRLARRRDLGQCRRAGAADDQVRVPQPLPHVVEKRLDVGLNPRAPDRPRAPFPHLVLPSGG